MGTPEHFFQRLDRLNGADMDRAMRLYHHRDELRRVIAESVADAPVAEALADAPVADFESPDRDERVAVPLREGADAPRVVLTRSGEFVTCLAAGMRAGNLLTVPYARFEAALEARAALDPGLQSSLEIQRRFTFRTLFRSLHTLGPHLSREHIDWLSAHGEVTGWIFARSLGVARKTVEKYTRVLRLRRWVSSAQWLAYWRVRWAYFLQLVTCAELRAGGTVRHAWEALVTGDDDVACFAAVALGKLVPSLPATLRALIRSESQPVTVRARMMLAVACAGLSHPGRRQGARAVLSAAANACGGTAALRDFARSLCAASARLPSLPRARRTVEMGALDQGLFSRAGREIGAALVLAYRPLREWARPLRESVADYRAARAGFERAGWVRTRRGCTAVRAEPKAGRNAGCACGSGAKFKRCCAERGVRAAA